MLHKLQGILARIIHDKGTPYGPLRHPVITWGTLQPIAYGHDIDLH
jgi:hypothetical protein